MSHKFNFPTWLEHCESVFEKCRKVPAEEGGWKNVLPLKDSHIFWLGDEQKFHDHVREIRESVREEMTEKLYMPYRDMALVSNFQEDKGTVWSFDRVIDTPDYLVDLIAPEKRQDFSVLFTRYKQVVLVMRYQVPENDTSYPNTVISWMIAFDGVKDGVLQMEVVPSRELSKLMRLGKGLAFNENMLAKETNIIVDQVGAISHPENYIVAVQPELTEREERRKAAGKSVSAQKMKHFIVLDHTVLVRMRSEHMGTHAPPIPHERRGHWRRLAERCRHAKLMGKDKVFVRPTIVGDLKWKGPGAIYEVLPQLNGPSVVPVSSP